MNPIQIEAWLRHPWLRHAFSSRTGGVSSVYGLQTLNLGWTKEDDPNAVAENRRLFTAAAAPGATLIGLRQIHSNLVHSLREPSGTLSTPEGKPLLESDGLITSLPGVLLAVGTADCVPVLVADTAQRVVAAFHAGWRGTVGRIVEHGIARMVLDFHSRPADLIAAIGPGIGPCCYTVGEEVRSQFAASFSYADTLFREQYPLFSLDLREANRRQLHDAGLADSQITLVAECTACSRSLDGTRRFFSHRAEQGVTGRMLNAIGIASQPASQP